MDLSRLTAKQKRVQFWTEYLETEVHDADLKSRTSEALEKYKKLLERSSEKDKS